MKKTRDFSNFIIEKPSFIDLIIGSLIHSLGLSKLDQEIKQFKNIRDYSLIEVIKKENGYRDSFVGYYINKEKKFFIKTLERNKKDYRNYFTISEWFISNILYETLKSKKSKISVPKPIEIIVSDESISLVYDFVDGTTLSLFDNDYQAKIFVEIINELKKISNSLTIEEINNIPKRSILFYFISLPYLSLLSFFRSGQNFKIVWKAFAATLGMLFTEKISSELYLAHRDLKPHNVIIKNSRIFLIDTGRMALTLSGYDLALLSLDPRHTALTKSLEKNLQISKFLQSYIAIQFSGPNDSVGKKYWEFLKSEYADKKIFSKAIKLNASLIFLKGTLAYRYLYHKLFSNLYHLGERVTFKSGITIHNGERISIGNRVYLEKNITLKFLEEFSQYDYKSPNLIIDDGVTIGEGTIISAAKLIHIKKDVLIAPYCFIGDHDHEYQNISVPIRDQGYKNVKDVVIEEGAWIAVNSTICSGVTIGRNSIVGANSVVTKDVPAFSLAVGTPAKIVKRFNKAINKWEDIK